MVASTRHGAKFALITTWKAQLEGGAADVFGLGGGTISQAPAVDVNTRHAKIGELILESEFLEGALSNAGLLSAKRCSTSFANASDQRITSTHSAHMRCSTGVSHAL